MKGETTDQQIISYFKRHWIAIILGAIPATFVALFTLINTFVSFELNYDELRTTVSANAIETHTLEEALQSGQVSGQISLNQLLTRQKDQQAQLNTLSGQVDVIYNYVLIK